ncbi:MAG: CBS domain-containing protein [Candidatus Nitrohelix vancouverensis]|uniref:CBS domain-containing protein n=1 Tax=Candidatus Nitrohelix vancouverensis TaxID=2705534 RepID=A0A7T0G4E3_9BACT|nr:MAG: CBS domain-containing protein [Candidatus Nitrohelix vancouverensis]
MMIVEEVMTTKLITISENDTLLQAQQLMVEKSVRHLPVVKKRKLLGIITESDIRSAFIFDGRTTDLDEEVPVNPAKMKVKNYMTKEPLTVSPETNIEDAALIIYRNKIGGLPVVKDDKLEGIISIIDMLGLFIDMMGILHGSSRIDVLTDKSQKSLDKVSKIINDHGLNIIATGIEPFPQDDKKQICFFRVDLCETEPIVVDIEKAGFKVLDAID